MKYVGIIFIYDSRNGPCQRARYGVHFDGGYLYNCWVHFHILKLFWGLFRSPEGDQSQYSPARKITNIFVITSNGEDCYAAPSTKLRN